jgi:hypothetical protein
MDIFLTRDAILQASDLPYEDVHVPEWNGTVRVTGLNAKDTQTFMSRLVEVDANGKVQRLHTDTIMTDLLVRTLVNDQNLPLFQQEDVETLGRKSGKVLARLFQVAQRLSGMDNHAMQASLKNSEGTLAGDLHID